MQPRLVTQPPVAAAEPSLALVVSPPRTSGLRYAGGAVRSPVSVAGAALGACLGLAFAGPLGAIAATIGVLSLATASSRSGAIRRFLDAQAAARERYRRESKRLARLAPAGRTRVQQYIELRELVEQVERADARDASRFELQDLLDHFIRLSEHHQRCLEALRLSGSHDLPQVTSLRDATRRRREIMARRHKHRELCLARVERLADEVAAVDELIRLVAQRAACPDADLEMEREIDRRLWELDEVDAAYHQLNRGDYVLTVGQ